MEGRGMFRGKNVWNSYDIYRDFKCWKNEKKKMQCHIITYRAYANHVLNFRLYLSTHRAKTRNVRLLFFFIFFIKYE